VGKLAKRRATALPQAGAQRQRSDIKKYSFAAKIRATKSGSEPKHPEDDSSAMQMHGFLSKMVALQILPRENSLNRLRTISSPGIFRLSRHLRSDFAEDDRWGKFCGSQGF
jgi:hypothetical protein